MVNIEEGFRFNRDLLPYNSIKTSEDAITLTYNKKSRVFSGSVQEGDSVKLLTYKGKRWVIGFGLPYASTQYTASIYYNDRIYVVTSLVTVNPSLYRGVRIFYYDKEKGKVTRVFVENRAKTEWALESYVVYNGVNYYIFGAFESGAVFKVSESLDSTTLISTGGPYTNLRFPSIVYFNGKFWYAAGRGFESEWPHYPTYPKMIYSSNDAISWTYEGDLPYPIGITGGSCIYNGKWWIFGLYNGNFHKRVYNTTNGVDWTLVAEQGAPLSNTNARAEVFAGKMWIFINASNKAYYSTDGVNWTLFNLNFTYNTDGALCWDPDEKMLYFSSTSYQNFVLSKMKITV